LLLIVEIQFFDYIWPAMMQIRDSSLRFAGAPTIVSPRLSSSGTLFPFGEAKIVKPGDSLTAIAHDTLVHKALLAAREIEQHNPGRTVEVIDLRTLAPYDWEQSAPARSEDPAADGRSGDGESIDCRRFE